MSLMLRKQIEWKTNHVQTTVLYSFFFGTSFNFLHFNIFNNVILVFNKGPLRDPNFPNADYMTDLFYYIYEGW